MGYAFENACFVTELEAQVAFCASNYPRTRIDGSNHLADSCSLDADGVSIVTTVAETGVASSVGVPLTFATCDPGYQVGMLALLFVAGLTGLVGILALRGALWPLHQNQ